MGTEHWLLGSWDAEFYASGNEAEGCRLNATDRTILRLSSATPRHSAAPPRIARDEALSLQHRAHRVHRALDLLAVHVQVRHRADARRDRAHPHPALQQLREEILHRHPIV